MELKNHLLRVKPQNIVVIGLIMIVSLPILFLVQDQFNFNTFFIFAVLLVLIMVLTLTIAIICHLSIIKKVIK